MTFPYITKRKVHVTEADLLMVARADSTPINKFSEGAQAQLTALSTLLRLEVFLLLFISHT